MIFSLTLSIPRDLIQQIKFGVIILFGIREVSDSNLDWGTVSLLGLYFPQSLQANAWIRYLT
jgi:hypothetical protein